MLQFIINITNARRSEIMHLVLCVRCKTQCNTMFRLISERIVIEFLISREMKNVEKSETQLTVEDLIAHITIRS